MKKETQYEYDYGRLRYRLKHPIKFLKCWLRTGHQYEFYGSMGNACFQACIHCGKERLEIIPEGDE